MPSRTARGNLAQRLMQHRDVGRPAVVRANSGYLYSTYFFPNALAVGDYDLYVTPVGQNGQGFPPGYSLTYTETNLINAQRIPDQTAYRFNEIGVYIDSRAPLSDINTLINTSNFRINKTEYNYHYGPLHLFPGGAGVAGATADAATPTQAWSNGWPTPTARVKLGTPIELDPGETFKFTINVTQPGTLLGSETIGETLGTRVEIILWGKSASEIAP